MNTNRAQENFIWNVNEAVGRAMETQTFKRLESLDTLVDLTPVGMEYDKKTSTVVLVCEAIGTLGSYPNVRNMLRRRGVGDESSIWPIGDGGQQDRKTWEKVGIAYSDGSVHYVIHLKVFDPDYVIAKDTNF